ncbi:MAG TPA: PAS domain S-box protein [Bacteroidales bacterium]|nr:PAS domain S-box protein [Bacteroidales bacterium]
MFRTRQIKIIISWSAILGLIGSSLTIIILVFSLLSSEHSGVHELYSSHNEFYLLNLIPLILIIAGAFIGKKVSDNLDISDRRIAEYEKIINQTVDFVKNVEKQDLCKQYVPVNGENILANALESMRTSLIQTSRKEQERNEINKISNEIIALLQNCDTLEKLSEKTTVFLVSKLEGIVQGAFYIVEGINEDDDTKNIIRMKYSYAYNRRKYLHAEFKFAQGLVGQAAVEKDIILRTEIPDDYLTITSGLLGEKKPRSLIISPLIADNEVYGVIELASLTLITKHHYDLLKETGSIIARTIANLKHNQRTYKLLQQSELMSSELISQKKQLTTNAQDLLKTQEELKSANIKLGEQIKEVHNAGKKIQVLLENSKEVITIVSEDKKIKYVSPSIKSIMGYYIEEIMGQNYTLNIHPLDTEKYDQMLSDLKSFPEKEFTLQFRYFIKNGEVIWMEAKGKNLLSDSVINGFVINSRDISEQRQAAKEQRIRAKMQALSENSSDIIIRIDIFSRCTYVNPIIEEYTGIPKDTFIGKPLSNIEMDQNVISNLKILLEDTAKNKLKRTSEMTFPTPAENKIMQVNAIPEFGENGESESVLFVCHDITEAKAREELIKKKNKSISDSINYAFNIQSALMPTEESLRKLFPNSFMFYKPKDVVSGDYPCLIRHGDSIFIGAMDCTGHGVPGAMMSIIGFFLQDAIINQKKELNAGEVLNRLHQNVVEKLKQAEPGSKINDGMDAAFLRINLKKRELDFSGAHRPLYHVSNNVMTEVKGDKWPVGSTQYRNRKEFTNNTIQINPGDAFYFMTDGFPDQFGGASGKERFTSDRVAKLINENTHLSIFQMGNLFRNTFEEWRGPINQLDDILIMGLKF